MSLDKDEVLTALTISGGFGRMLDVLLRTEVGELTVQECYDHLWLIVQQTDVALKAEV